MDVCAKNSLELRRPYKAVYLECVLAALRCWLCLAEKELRLSHHKYSLISLGCFAPRLIKGGKEPRMTATIDLENTYTSGVYSKRPVVIVRGYVALLWDEEGREYIDCAAGHGVANIGHGRPEIAAALAAQAQRLITCPEIVYNDVRARLLERLAGLTPTGLTHFFLCKFESTLNCLGATIAKKEMCQPGWR